jgi:deoxyribose-phosphate aldolase
VRLTIKEIARLIDVSCVNTISSKADIKEMVAAALKYGFGHVSVLQSFIPYTLQLLKGTPAIRLVGNVSFPSGSDSTSLKIIQARQIASSGCDEIDMVMNIGKLRSGELTEVEDDVRQVIQAIQPIPVKVIIEIMYLTEVETKQACDICVRNGAAFIKTSTGWADRGTTPQDVRLIKSLVGDQIQIKASGGIRSLDMLVELHRAGARRFGMNHKSGIQIMEECLSQGSMIEI